MALPIATLERGTLDSKLAKVIFGDDSEAVRSPLSPEEQMRHAHRLIERLAELPRPIIEWHAPRIDRGVIVFFKGPARRLVCEWLREHHPNVCASMPEVTECMDSMIRAVGYNAWFQPETLMRLELAARAARVTFNGVQAARAAADQASSERRGFGAAGLRSAAGGATNAGAASNAGAAAASAGEE